MLKGPFLAAVCISPERGMRKSPVQTANALEAHGLEGDAHAGSGTRQVSLLSTASLERMRAERGPDASDVLPGCCGENVDVDGMELHSLLPGVVLLLCPAPARLRVTEIGKPDHEGRADSVIRGNIFPREGIFAEVLESGEVSPGSEVTVERSGSSGSAAVLTVSDSCFQGERIDESGPEALRLLSESGFSCTRYATVPDEMEEIGEKLRSWCDDGSIDLLITTGGTGLSPRDVTPEATLAQVSRVVPGLAELVRIRSSESVPTACLSRAVAGIRSGVLVMNLPGSVRAVRQSMDILAEALPHALETISGKAHRCGDTEERV